MLKTFFSSNSDDLKINDLRVAVFNLLFAKNHDGESLIKVSSDNLSENLNKIGVKNLLITNSGSTQCETKDMLLAKDLLKKDGDDYIFHTNIRENIRFYDVILGEIIIEPAGFNGLKLIENNKLSEKLVFIEECYQNQVTHVIRNESEKELIKLQHLINTLLKRTSPGSALIPDMKQDNITLSSLLNEGFSGNNIFNYIATIGRTQFQMVCPTTKKLEDTFSVSSLASTLPEFDKKHLEWMNSNCHEE